MTERERNSGRDAALAYPGSAHILTALRTGRLDAPTPPVQHRRDVASHRKRTASQSKWRSRPLRWPSLRIPISSPTTSRHCATSCGARLRSARGVAETVTRRTGVSWLPAYGTTDCLSSPVIRWTVPRLDSRRTRRARRRPAGGVVGRTGEPVARAISGEIQAPVGVADGGLPAAESHRGSVVRRLVTGPATSGRSTVTAGCGSRPHSKR